MALILPPLCFLYEAVGLADLCDGSRSSLVKARVVYADEGL